MNTQYVIGIDLGTTNSVLAYSPVDDVSPQVFVLPVPQLVAPETTEALPMLPSFLYLPASDRPDHPQIVGQLARQSAAEFPDRTVSGAKSWLAHSRVDRHQPILPWRAPDDVPKQSPVQVSQRYLEHLVSAWQATYADAPLSEQSVILTVPASFDASARELTREAALNAGLPDSLVLLEEPQAALYSWLNDEGDRWRKQLQAGDRLLVCDVGGGTTDLTLVEVVDEAGQLELNRVAVGNHLLIGGDNMDLALAHLVAERFREQGIELDPWQSVSLWHSCRNAKEQLLSDRGPETQSITIAGRGRRLVGNSVTVSLDRQQTAELLLDGFFPLVSLSDQPIRSRSSGFRELGLPYESDTAISRHLAAFLSRSLNGQPLTHVLFNGGVFKAAQLRQRVMQMLTAWFPDRPPAIVDGADDLDFSVARGACAYGWLKRRGGMRIRGGTARSYYVGIESAGLAVPGAPRPLKALCVVPQGMEEGTQIDVPSDPIGLVVGEPERFRFFSSSDRGTDQAGLVLARWSPDELQETDSLEATLPATDASDDDYVPVRFESRVTELGTLELWCVEQAASTSEPPRRWKLEFSVRDDAEA